MTTEQIWISAIAGLLSAGLGAFATLIITRKSKYLDTITTERIKWISSVRSDLTRLAAALMMITQNQNRLKWTLAEKRRNDEAFSTTGRDPEQLTSEEVSYRIELSEDIKTLSATLDKVLQPGEIIELAYLLKLKFNPDDDRDIIYELDKIIETISDLHADPNGIEIRTLVNCSQLVLKREWDKVKAEAKAIFSL